MKTARQLERYFKGAANHWRLEVILLLNKKSGQTLEEISDRLGCNIKTLSEHTHRLVKAGLLNKEYKGRTVVHSLSPYGEKFVKFAKSF